MVQKSRVRVGAVSFLNTKPLIYDLLCQVPPNDEIEISVHVPSRLAELMESGNLDVGLIPIIEYFRAAGQSNVPPYKIIPHTSISSRGPVRSIQLYSHVPISTIRCVGLDTSSRSSRALLQIVFAERYDLHPKFCDCPPSIDPQAAEMDAVLLIGDAALRRLGSTPYSLDLGAEWDKLTGLPFVYACWVTRNGVDLGNTIQILQRAKEFGIRKIPRIARVEAEELHLPEELCRDYLTDHVFYDLGKSEIAGLNRFYELAVKYDLATPGVSLTFA